MAAQMSDREAAVYDRSIRTWGAEAQKRLMDARVLFVGFDGLAAELSKNLVLAGVGAVLHDDSPVDEKDLAANFFIKPEDVGQPRAKSSLAGVKELNPLVAVELLEGDLPASSSAQFWASFAVCCTNGLSLSRNRDIAAICRSHGIAFFAGFSHGASGAVLSDMGPSHQYKQPILRDEGDDEAKAQPAAPPVYVVAAPTFADALSSPLTSFLAMLYRKRRRDPTASTSEAAPAWAAIRGMEQAMEEAGASADASSLVAKVEDRLRAEAEASAATAVLEPGTVERVGRGWRLCVSPVCAVLGGNWGQEVIRCITGRSPPLGNLFVLDVWSAPNEAQYGWVPAAPTPSLVSGEAEGEDEEAVALSDDD